MENLHLWLFINDENCTQPNKKERKKKRYQVTLFHADDLSA